MRADENSLTLVNHPPRSNRGYFALSQLWFADVHFPGIMSATTRMHRLPQAQFVNTV
jgi:hypothetical protein